jgi:hypothetical protein
LGTAATWAAAWAGAGLSIGVLSVLAPALPLGWFFEVFDAPLPALALPGFLAGLCYAVVVSIAGRRRPLRDIRLAEVAGWGVTGGLLLSAIPALALLDNGPSDAPNGDWRIPAAIAVLITFSVASAVGSFVLAQRAARADDRRLRERLTDVLTGAAASTAALPPVHGTVSPGFDDSQRTRESSAARGRP